MSIVADWRPVLEAEEYLDWPGLQGGSVSTERLREALPAVLARIENEELVRPRFAYGRRMIAAAGDDWLDLHDGTRFESFPVVRCRLEGAHELVAAVGTLGPDLEREISEAYRRKQAMDALLMAELAIAMLFGLGAAIRDRISGEASARHLHAGDPIVPGDRHIDLSHQRVLIDIAGGGDIGVSVSSGAMLVPVNTVSMFFGLGESSTALEASPCERCGARDRCRHRRDHEAWVP